MSDLDDFSWENMNPNDNKYDTNEEGVSNIREAEGVPVPNNTVTPQVNKEIQKEEQYKKQLQQQKVQGQRPQGQRPQGQRPQGQRPQGQRPQGQRPQGQRPQGQRHQGQRPQGQRPQGQIPQGQRQQMSNQVKRQPQAVQKKKSKKGLVIGLVLIGLVGIVGVTKFKSGSKQVIQEIIVETTGKYAYDNLLESIHSLDATKIDAVVGTKDGDSYIAQEWAYINGVALRQEFLTKVSGLVDFKYPESVQMDKNGNPMLDAEGNQIMESSYMNNGENVTVTIPDYVKIASEMDADKEYIVSLMESAGYKPTDYDWSEEMANLMFQWILDRSKFPTTTVEMALPIGNNGQAYVKDDSLLDDALYGSEAFRNMSDKFSQVAMQFTGYKDEEYTDKEEQHNDEYDDWFKLFMKYYKEDGGKYDKKTKTFKGGKFKKGVSKWEPWFLRDDNNKFIYDENGEKVVNYYSVKKKDGTDWIQPDETIMVEVKKTRQVEDPWLPETGIRYNILGTHYITTMYNGLGDTSFRVGDGTKENPAGIGTSIITVAPCTDGKFHDVKVTLIGYWTKQNAIDYVESFDTRNRGFSTTSAVSLITYEVRVQNLESKPITVKADMALSDGNSNVSSRTGTVYGFESEKIIQPGETVVINDWATSTELEQKYVVWGKSFGRNYAMVYFDCLAGTGKIPSYSAYKAFTGESSLNSQFVAEEMETQQAMPESSDSSEQSTESSESSESSETEE